ncbi:hypothetical protein PR048_018630 [Dryococelus australis]|uniref:Reverse transcriptase domain-containing protein n=1 Tax=Dryococelus australis TaxID=614101 RepID=A0ABQ9HD10_9NEOP|nr:hypothetical protein PR048_018630 [Dryococelus australis]
MLYYLFLYSILTGHHLNLKQGDYYPLPRIDDVFTTLGGGNVITLLDLKNAYQKLEVPDQYQHLLPINTHRGLFHFKRLPYGVASAPAI